MGVVAGLAVLFSLVAAGTIDHPFMGGGLMAIATFGDIIGDLRAMTFMAFQAGELFFVGSSSCGNLLVLKIMALLAVLYRQGRLNRDCPQQQKDESW